MRKVVMFITFVLLLSSASALSSTLEERYRPSETIIAQLSRDIISTIENDQLNLLRDGYIDVGFEFGIQKISGQHNLWLIAPQTPGNYTLKIEDIVASVGGVPEVVDFEQEFIVGEERVEYSIKPGVISTTEDFSITVILHEDFSQTIQTDFPESREIVLLPGDNSISYDTGSVFGNQLIDITVGDYVFPAFIQKPESVCGDGVISGEEVCDGNETLGVTCEALNVSYVSGNVSCSIDCLSYNETECELSEGNNTVVFVCGVGAYSYCEIEEACLDVDGYWYDDSCHEFEKGAVCDENYKELCENPEECVEARGYWYDDVCNSHEEIISGEPRFAFVPTEMDLVILVGEERPRYSFVIRNRGDVRIDDVKLEYNRARFVITPEESVSLDVNESKSFSLEILEEVRGETQGAIVASLGEYNEYMLVKLTSTENADDVTARYGGDEGYRCAELNGLVCGSGEICSSSLVSAIDAENCCTGTCQEIESEGGSRTWIGYLVGGIIVVGGLIIFVKYRKTGKKGSPTKQRFAMAEKRLP